jgi:hypothetical protein
MSVCCDCARIESLPFALAPPIWSLLPIPLSKRSTVCRPRSSLHPSNCARYSWHCLHFFFCLIFASRHNV